MTSIDIEQYPDTVEAFGGNKQRATVFLDRYALKDEQGQPVERLPHDMWVRVAADIGEPGNEEADFFGILEDFKFVPGGRILAGAGTGREVTFYNCYVIPVETEARRWNRDAEVYENRRYDEGNDSRRAIFDTIGRMVDIMSRGGGVGINWSVLRPQGAYLKTVNGTSSGPVGWMDVASKAVGEVEQGGSRRGAAMFMLDDWHPDVLNFINAKRDLGRITNANVSVAVSDAFMQAVKEDADWALVFPDTSHERYDAEWDGDIEGWRAKGYPVRAYAVVKARDIWRALVEAAWDNGEPGVVFLDRYNKMSTGRSVERIISVNPCGEQGLGPYSVCNLGAMNFDAYVQRTDSGVFFRWTNYEEDVRTAVRFLDNVIDKNYYFIPENEDIQKRLRRIGLGGMGLADALIGMGFRYGSEKAVHFTENLFETMRYEAIRASVDLAKEKGPAPAWDPSMAERPYFAWLKEYDPLLWDEVRGHGVRNIFLLTQAPTGTTSILAGASSGIEPVYAWQYWRTDRTGKHKVWAGAVEKYGPKDAAHEDFIKPEDPESIWVTANEVTVEEHIAMQAAAQRHIDSSVSKTINAPNSHTFEDVDRAYMLAYDSGLKGIAYFRDGCGRAQVLSREGAENDPEPLKAEIAVLQAKLEDANKRRTRPATLKGETRRVMHVGGSAYVTLNRDENGEPFELFVLTGKAGSDVMMLGEAVGRLASLAMQHGASAQEVADELTGIGGYRKFGASMPHAVGMAIEALLMDELPPAPVIVPEKATGLQASDTMTQQGEMTGQLCPKCETFSVVMQEGCSKCYSCDWSAC